MSKKGALVTTVGSLHILWLKHTPKNLTWNLKMQALVGQGDSELTDQFSKFLQKKISFV